MIPDSKIAEWQRLADAATPGPWRTGRKVGRTLYNDDMEGGALIGVMDTREDAALVEAMREAVPALLAERRELLREGYIAARTLRLLDEAFTADGLGAAIKTAIEQVTAAYDAQGSK